MAQRMTTKEIEHYYAENPEQRGEPQRKQTKMRRVGAIVGWALLFWIVTSIPVGLGLTILGVNEVGRTFAYLAALIIGGLYGAGIGSGNHERLAHSPTPSPDGGKLRRGRCDTAQVEGSRRRRPPHGALPD
jgi:hypothetical protein